MTTHVVGTVASVPSDQTFTNADHQAKKTENKGGDAAEEESNLKCGPEKQHSHEEAVNTPSCHDDHDHTDNVQDGMAVTKSRAIHFTPYSSITSVKKALEQRKYRQAWRNCKGRWPRCFAVMVKTASLSCLICWALALGYYLSTFEGPQEVDSNDMFMRQSYLLAELPVSETINLLLNLPTECFDRFLQGKATAENITELMDGGVLTNKVDSLQSNQFWNDTTNQAILIHGNNYSLREAALLLANESSLSPRLDQSNTTEVLLELYKYMEMCENVSSYYLYSLINYTKESAAWVNDTSDVLSFNWIRCWNRTELGDPNPYRPNQAQINASAKQGQWYATVWLLDQESLYQQYVDEWNCDLGDFVNRTKCFTDAREKATQEATGGKGCASNTGSSAWFWFTFMTTVGYGECLGAFTLGG